MEFNDIFITITGYKFYSGIKPFKVGAKLKIIKEPDNIHDPEAIAVYDPVLDKVGFVSNSVHTTVKGTMSAGRLHTKIPDECAAIVSFIADGSVIARVIADKKLKVKVDISFEDIELPDCDIDFNTILE